ncbi:unnamed protein product [Caretta caretta]
MKGITEENGIVLVKSFRDVSGEKLLKSDSEETVEGSMHKQELKRLITRMQTQRAQKMMKCGKAVGPDDAAIKAFQALGHEGVVMINFFHIILQTGKMPKWRKNTLVSIFKLKGAVPECNYQPITLKSLAVKWLERITEKRLYEELEHQATNNQFGFIRGRSAMAESEYCRSTGRNTRNYR